MAIAQTARADYCAPPPSARAPSPSVNGHVSVLLVGRSGTGKTTVALQRLYDATIDAQLTMLRGDVPSATLFVCKSSKLCEQVPSATVLAWQPGSNLPYMAGEPQPSLYGR